MVAAILPKITVPKWVGVTQAVGYNVIAGTSTA